MTWLWWVLGLVVVLAIPRLLRWARLRSMLVHHADLRSVRVRWWWRNRRIQREVMRTFDDVSEEFEEAASQGFMRAPGETDEQLRNRIRVRLTPYGRELVDELARDELRTGAKPRDGP